MTYIWERVNEDLCGVKASLRLEDPHHTSYVNVIIHQVKPGAIWFSDECGIKRFYSGNYLVEIFKEEENDSCNSMDSKEISAGNPQN